MTAPSRPAQETVSIYLNVVTANSKEELSSKWVIVTKGFSGDAHLFWRAEGRGYTSDLLEAGIYTKKSALAQECSRPDQDRAVSLASLLENGGITVAVNSERTNNNLMTLENTDG